MPYVFRIGHTILLSLLHSFRFFLFSFSVQLRSFLFFLSFFRQNNTQRKTTKRKVAFSVSLSFSFVSIVHRERERETFFSLPCLVLFCVHPRAFVVVVFFPSRISVVLVELNCALMDREKVAAPNIYLYIYIYTAQR